MRVEIWLSMKKLPRYAGIVLVILILNTVVFAAGKPRVLVFSLTKGFHHNSIVQGIAAIQKMGAENNFAVDTTTSELSFTPKNLKKYKALIFLSTTGEFLNTGQRAAFQHYIRKGGGFVGIHAATDCLYEWTWYGKLVGAYFLKHPKIQPAKLLVKDQTHLSTQHLPAVWERTDEWYNFKSVNPDLKVLVTIDESSYTGGTMGSFHPMAWYHEFEGGRVFYTELGHTAESFTGDELYLKHLLGGIRYAIGEGK